MQTDASSKVEGCSREGTLLSELYLTAVGEKCCFCSPGELQTQSAAAEFALRFTGDLFNANACSRQGADLTQTRVSPRPGFIKSLSTFSARGGC